MLSASSRVMSSRRASCDAMASRPGPNSSKRANGGELVTRCDPGQAFDQRGVGLARCAAPFEHRHEVRARFDAQARRAQAGEQAFGARAAGDDAQVRRRASGGVHLCEPWRHRATEGSSWSSTIGTTTSAH